MGKETCVKVNILESSPQDKECRNTQFAHVGPRKFNIWTKWKNTHIIQHQNCEFMHALKLHICMGLITPILICISTQRQRERERGVVAQVIMTMPSASSHPRGVILKIRTRMRHHTQRIAAIKTGLSILKSPRGTEDHPNPKFSI